MREPHINLVQRPTAVADRRLRPGRPRRLELLIVFGILAASVAAALLFPARPSRGLTGRYWDNAEWRGTHVRSAAVSEFSVTAIGRVLPEGVSEQFSAEWTGSLFIDTPGVHRFDLESDDGAVLEIENGPGKLVADNGGTHGKQIASVSSTLSRGAHRIRLRYFQAGGDLALSLRWTPPGGVPIPIPANLLTPDGAAGRSGWDLLTPPWFGTALASLWAAALLYLPARFFLVWAFRRIRATQPDALVGRGMLGVGLAGAGLSLWGIGWDLPGWLSWVPDELDPASIHDAIDHWFSSGWHGLYGPLQYYFLALPLTAVRAVEHLGFLQPDAWTRTVEVLWMRGLSVCMGLGTLAVTYLIGVEVAGARRAFFATAALLFTPTFAYYAKTANVDIPYLFWLALAMLAYVRIIKFGLLADHVFLGVTAAAAVGTKDQAFGFFVLVPVAILILEVVRRRRSGRSALAALWDRKLVLGGLASAGTLILIHNLPWNLSGFLEHVALIRTWGGAYREFEPSVSGHAQLAAKTLAALRWSLGWPTTVLAAWGVASAMARPGRRWWLWLLLPIGSYYVTYLMPILYVYDRFLLGVQLVLAVFAGAAAVDLLTVRRWRVVGVILVAGAYGFSALNALSVDVLMARDSRKNAGAWVARCIPLGASIAVVGSQLYSPGFLDFQPQWLLDGEVDFNRARFDYIVVNTRYARRLTAPAPFATPLDFLRRPDSAYWRVARFHARMPSWAVLTWESVFSSERESTLTNISKINPEIVVYTGATSAPSCGMPTAQ